MKRLMFLVIFIYMLLGSMTFHPDGRLILSYAQLSKGRGWNIYTILDRDRINISNYHYPPLNFAFVKSEWKVLSLIGGEGFEDWLKQDLHSSYKNDNMVFYNLLSKMPLYLLLLVDGFVIYKLALKIKNDKKLAKLATVIWLLNPVTLYSVVFMGQNDLLAITPFLFGLLFYFKNPVIAFILFGIGAGFKNFPLVWAMLLAFIYPVKGNKYFKKFLYMLVSLVVYVVPMLFFIGNKSFTESVFGSGLMGRIFIARIDLGFGDSLLLIPFLLAIVAVKAFMLKKINMYIVSKILMVTSMILVFFCHFHPQWVLWIIPFWTLFCVYSPKKDFAKNALIGVLITLAYLLIIILYNDKFLTWGMFLPVNIGLSNLPVIGEYLITKGVDVSLLNNLCHSLLAAITVFSILKIDQKNDEN